MSKIKSERAYASKRFDQFVGIGERQSLNGKNATEMINFRLSSDGTLKKRNGYRLHREFPDTVRAYWEGTINQTPFMFAICGNGIYYLDPNGDLTQIDTVPNTYDDLNFFYYENNVYLADGTGIRAYNAGSVSFPYITPYVPLYGKSWDPVSLGSANEPFNLLTNRIRVQYTNTSGATVFHLPFYARSVDGVKVNGRSVDYTFVSLSDTVTLSSQVTGLYVEIALEVSLAEDAAGIKTATRSTVYTAPDRNTVCLYGAECPYNLYTSAPIDTVNLFSCRSIYPNAAPLYFKDEDIFIIGSRVNPITAICPYQDRALVYTKDSTWQLFLNEDNRTLAVIPLLRGIGCCSSRAATVCGDTPVAINQKGVFLLQFSSDKNEPPSCKSITGGIKEYLTADFVNTCCATEDPVSNELWISSPNTEKPQVLVYHLTHRQWYLFDHMDAEFFIDCSDRRCFASGKKIYALDNTCFDDAGEPIIASVTSSFFDFSHPEQLKRALRVTVAAQTNGSPAYLRLETDRTERTFELIGKDSPSPEIFDSRALVGRFRMLRFRILTGGDGDFRLYSVTFLANL